MKQSAQYKEAQSLVKNGTTHSYHVLTSGIIPDAILDGLLEKVEKNIPKMLKQWGFNPIAVRGVSILGNSAIITLISKNEQQFKYEVTIKKVK